MKNKNTNSDEIHNEFEFKHLFLNKQTNTNIYGFVYGVCSEPNKSIDLLHFILKHKQCNLNQKYKHYSEIKPCFYWAWESHQWDKVSFLFVLQIFTINAVFLF